MSEVYLRPMRKGLNWNLLHPRDYGALAAKAETILVVSQAIKADLEAAFIESDGLLQSKTLTSQLMVLASSLKSYVDYNCSHILMEHTL